jgi:propanol-preferring alcohol dehydrogenase
MEVISLAAAGRIRAHVQRFDLADAPTAYQAMRDKTLDGRAVIVP